MDIVVVGEVQKRAIVIDVEIQSMSNNNEEGKQRILKNTKDGYRKLKRCGK